MKLKQKLSLIVLSFATSSLLIASDIPSINKNIGDISSKVNNQDKVLNKYGSAIIKIIKDKKTIKKEINNINNSLIEINQALSENQKQMKIVKEELNQDTLKDLKELSKKHKDLKKEINRIELLITEKGDQKVLNTKIEEMISKNNGSKLDEEVINKLIELKINQNNEIMINDLNKKISKVESKNKELLEIQKELRIQKVTLENLEKSIEMKINVLESKLELINKSASNKLHSETMKEEVKQIEDGYYIIKSDVSKKVNKNINKITTTSEEIKILTDKILSEVIDLIDQKNIEMENRIYGVINKKFSKYDKRFEKIEARLDKLEKNQKKNFEILKSKIEKLKNGKDIKLVPDDGYKEINLKSLKEELRDELKEELKNELKSQLMSKLEAKRAKFKDIAHRLSDKINYIHEYKNMKEDVLFSATIGIKKNIYSSNKPFFYNEKNLTELNKNTEFKYGDRIVVSKANSKGWMKIIEPAGAGWIGQQYLYINKKIK